MAKDFEVIIKQDHPFKNVFGVLGPYTLWRY